MQTKSLYFMGYPEHIIREDGLVIGSRGPINTHINSSGYVQIQLQYRGIKKTTLLHRIIAMAFIPNPENKPYVNHKDCNKLNNKLDNLEWVTHKENMQHAVKANRRVGRPTIR